MPPVTVEGKAPKTKKSGAKAAPKVAPVPLEQTGPVPAAKAAAARDKTRSEAVYTTQAAVSTAGKGELDTFGQLDTGNVLRTMPGTFTRENPQNPGVAVNIRGLEGSGRVNMMIDGVRQTFRFTGHEAQGFAYVGPALLAGVDIARSAVSTVGGAGACRNSQPAHARRGRHHQARTEGRCPQRLGARSNRGESLQYELHCGPDHADCSFGPATPTKCFGSNTPNCSDYGRGRTFLFSAKAQF